MKCILYAHELYTLLWWNLICPLRIEAAFSGSPKFPILLNIFFFNFSVVFRSLDWDSHEDQNLGPASQVTHQACTHLKTLILRVTELERLRGGGGLVAISLVEKKQPLVERETLPQGVSRKQKRRNLDALFCSPHLIHGTFTLICAYSQANVQKHTYIHTI